MISYLSTTKIILAINLWNHFLDIYVYSYLHKNPSFNIENMMIRGYTFIFFELFFDQLFQCQYLKQTCNHNWYRIAFL